MRLIADARSLAADWLFATAEAAPVLFPDEAVLLDEAAFRDELPPEEPRSSVRARSLDEAQLWGEARFPDEACSLVGVASRGEAYFARGAWPPYEVQSPVEMQLADGVPQDGLLELRLVFLEEVQSLQVAYFLVWAWVLWPVG
jgi:hypothetical protein